MIIDWVVGGLILVDFILIWVVARNQRVAMNLFELTLRDIKRIKRKINKRR